MKANVDLPSGAQGRAWLVGRGLQRIAPHHHDELELNLVVSGKANYIFEQRRVSITAASMLWIFPRQEHVLFDWSHDFSMWVLIFKQKLVRQLTGPASRRVLRSRAPGDIFSRQVDFRQLEILHQIYHDAVDPHRDPGFAQAALEYALVRSWQAYLFSRESISRTDVHAAVAKSVRLLSIADGHVPLDVLAREAGLSPGRLSRLFKQQIGINLTGFQQQECLKRFFGLYRTGARYSLIEAALLAGFGSYAQFHRVFQRLMGKVPLPTRKPWRPPARNKCSCPEWNLESYRASVRRY